MTDMLDGPFPGWDEDIEEDLLGGMEDRCGGKALDYFLALSPEDREITQWYLEQGLFPKYVEEYVSGLVKGYAITDPDRKASLAIDMAEREIDRIGCYLDIFLQATDFFPGPALYVDRLIDSETGETHSVETVAWADVTEDGLFTLAEEQTEVRTHILPLLICARAFLRDPYGAPDTFNQGRILQEHVQNMKSGLTEDVS